MSSRWIADESPFKGLMCADADVFEREDAAALRPSIRCAVQGDPWDDDPFDALARWGGELRGRWRCVRGILASDTSREKTASQRFFLVEIARLRLACDPETRHPRRLIPPIEDSDSYRATVNGAVLDVVRAHTSSSLTITFEDPQLDRMARAVLDSIRVRFARRAGDVSWVSPQTIFDLFQWLNMPETLVLTREHVRWWCLYDEIGASNHRALSRRIKTTCESTARPATPAQRDYLTRLEAPSDVYMTAYEAGCLISAITGVEREVRR